MDRTGALSRPLKQRSLGCATCQVVRPRSRPGTHTSRDLTHGVSTEFSPTGPTRERLKRPAGISAHSRVTPPQAATVCTQVCESDQLRLGSPTCVLRQAQDEGLSSCHENFPSS